MALTKIRGSQIQDHSIGNAHIDPTSPIVYSNLDLSHSIVATDLSTNHTVHTDVLDYKLVALWDLVQNLSVTGTSAVATAPVQAAAVTDTATNDGSAKGVLTTGTGVNGAGIENYKAQVRDAVTKDPVSDGIGGTVYGELTYSGGAYTLAFKKSDGSSFSMGAQEQVEITVNANTNNALHGKWFVIASPTATYRVILNYVGDPALTPIAGVVDVNATIANDDDAATVATAIRSALNGISSGTVFTATGSGSSVVVTTVAGVVMQGVSDGSGLYETDFVFATLAKGSPSSVDFMFEEIYSLNSAPLKGFVTGTGFTDVVTVTGSHNHNDLYYSKSELEAGQLDDRYYTEGELNAGQLDGRYYTESELTNGALDGRYYTESELGATTEGSSGASKIGISGVTGLDAGNIQGALAELQGDINNITSGNLDITHSLDDAYDDGSAITVDTTDVAWTMSAARSFKVVDGTDTSKFVVKAGSAADSIKMDTSGGLDIDTKAGLSIKDDSGAELSVQSTGATTLTGVSGQLMQVGLFDGSNEGGLQVNQDTTVSLTSNSTNQYAVMITPAGGLLLQTSNNRNIVVDSSNGITFDDANLTAALPLTQSGVTGLSANLTATSIIGAINENADDLDTLIDTTLPATTDGASGADMIGVTGITGVIPTGGSAGSAGTVQTMLEGIAMGAGGGKTFADIGAFTTAKSGGTYFKLNEPVFILDTNRWVIVQQQGTGVIEDTDWGYVANDTRAIGGTNYYINETNEISLTAVDTQIVGSTLAKMTGNNATVELDGNASMFASTGGLVVLTSDTKAEINGGALVDINGTSVTIAGALTATGAANDNMIISSSGLGETQINSTGTVSLNGGDIMVESGTGQIITFLSDTKITSTSEVEVEINGGMVDINAGTGLPITLDSDTLVALTGGVEVDLTATTIDINGAVDMDGASATFTTTGEFEVAATDSVRIKSDTEVIIRNLAEGGPQFKVDTANNTIQATTGNDSQINLYHQDLLGVVDIDADFIDMDAVDIALDGIITATNTVDEDLTITTTGIGEVVINSEKELNINAPYTSIAGDVTMPVDSWLSVGNIKVTSVDPTDEATISGSRSGTVNPLNKLVNSGFELGSGNTATSWSNGGGITRTNVTRYYGSYSMRFEKEFTETSGEILGQNLTGLTADTNHKVSVYAFGTVGAAISAQLAGGTAAVLIPVGTYPTWQRFDVTLADDNAEDGEFRLISAAGNSSNVYIDAVMVDEGSTLNDYFSDYKSELVFTIGDEDDDRIVFRSAGSATSDLVRINQSTVEILGNLLVSGTTTTVNSQDLLVADNQIVLNSNVTGTPSLDAYFRVERGTEDTTSIRWNEATDKWELTNDGTTFSQIVTAGAGGGGLSMDTAYDGGSSVTVDDTNVNFALAASKSFLISDGTDTNKFVVSAGSGAGSVKIDTTGGVDIDTNEGFMVADDAGGELRLTNDGFAILLSNSVAQLGVGTNTVDATTTKISLASLTSTENDSIRLITNAGGIDINTAATKPLTIDSGSFSVDGVLASNVSTTGADLTLSTITSGNLVLSSADAISATADSIGMTANENGDVELTTSGTGQTQLLSAQEIDLTGGAIDINAGSGQSVTIDSGTSVVINGGLLTQLDGTVIDVNGQMDFDGDLFDVNVTGTGASALKMVSAGGFEVDAAGAVSITGPHDSVIGINDLGWVSIKSKSSGTQVVEVSNSTGSKAFAISDQVIVINQVDTANNSIRMASSAGGIDIDAAATKPITLDSGSFSIDGVLASNVSVTGGNLVLSTITTGDLSLTSAGELVFSDSRLAGIEFTDASNTTLPGTATSIVGAINLAYSAAQGANTLDEVYDGETGARAITMDNGSVAWKITDDYAFAMQDSTGANILSAQALAAGDKVEIDATLDVAGTDATFALTGVGASSFKIDTTGGVDIDTDAGFMIDDDSGANLLIQNSGAVQLVSGGSQSLSLGTGGSGNIGITSVGGKVSLTSGSTATDSIKLASGGGVDIAAATDSPVAISTSGTGLLSLASTTEIDLTGGAIDINGGTNSDITVDAIGTGKVLLTSANAINLSAGASSEVKTTSGDLTLRTTGTGGELYIGDGRTGSLKLSDATNSTLPGGATSILAAIKAAYDNKGTEVTRAYHEVTAGTTDVSNDYVVTNIALLPATGTFPMSPSALRTLADPVHAVVYLNGLRLSDTEWRYSYDEGTSERRITFDGSNNITLVPGDLIMIDVEKITTVTA